MCGKKKEKKMLGVKIFFGVKCQVLKKSIIN